MSSHQLTQSWQQNENSCLSESNKETEWRVVTVMMWYPFKVIPVIFSANCTSFDIFGNLAFKATPHDALQPLLVGTSCWPSLGISAHCAIRHTVLATHFVFDQMFTTGQFKKLLFQSYHAKIYEVVSCMVTDSSSDIKDILLVLTAMAMCLKLKQQRHTSEEKLFESESSTFASPASSRPFSPLC